MPARGPGLRAAHLLRQSVGRQRLPRGVFVVAMSRLARILLIVLLAPLVAAPVAVGGATMGVGIMAVETVPDCGGCGPADAAMTAACDAACSASPMSLIAAAEAALPAASADRASHAVADLAGRAAPPEPHPPRPFRLP